MVHREDEGDNNVYEEYRASGNDLVDSVKKLIKEGNVHRVIIKNREGKVLLDIPVTVGVVGLAVAPVLVAVGALATVATDCIIGIERDPKAPPATQQGPGPRPQWH